MEKSVCNFVLQLVPIIVIFHALSGMALIRKMFSLLLHQLQAGYTSYVVQRGVSVVLAKWELIVTPK